MSLETQPNRLKTSVHLKSDYIAHDIQQQSLADAHNNVNDTR